MELWGVREGEEGVWVVEEVEGEAGEGERECLEVESEGGQMKAGV